MLQLLFSLTCAQGIELPTQYTVQVNTLNTDATGGTSTAVSQLFSFFFLFFSLLSLF